MIFPSFEFAFANFGLTKVFVKKQVFSSRLVKTSIGNAPISTNEMEALITNHVKEYVLTNTRWYKICRETTY